MNEQGTENIAMYASALIDNGMMTCMPTPGPVSGVLVQDAATAGIGGLDRFVYLRGVSGRRYVFSAVPMDRAGLYDACVFAWREAGAATAQPCAQAPCGAPAGQLYVHLTDAHAPDVVLSDLRDAA